MSTVLFERVVVWGMGNAHHVLNNLVVPNVVEFVVYLPWRLLHVVFPTSPATIPSSTQSDGGLGARAYGDNISRISGSSNKGAGLAARLQHLKAPTKTRIAVSDGVAKDSRQGRSPRSLRASRTGQEKENSGSASPVRPSPPVPLELQTDVALEGQAPASGLAGSGVSSRKDSSSEGDHLVGSGGSTPVAARGVGGGRAGRRRSFGEIVRATLTGDSQTRLRDHLFDLHTASPAPPPTLYMSDSTELRSDSIWSSSPSADKGHETEDRKSSPSTVSSDDYRTKKALKKPATQHSGGKSPPGGRTRYPTRRRPPESSPEGVRGSDGGGDEAAGRLNGRSSGGVRRRNGSARRATATDNANTDGGGSFGYTVGETPNMRAKRLMEWRRKRSDQMETQAAALRRRGTRGAGADVATGPSTSIVTRQGSGGIGRANSALSRGFRHVERFRSHVSGAGAETESSSGDVGASGSSQH